MAVCSALCILSCLNELKTPCILHIREDCVRGLIFSCCVGRVALASWRQAAPAVRRELLQP